MVTSTFKKILGKKNKKQSAMQSNLDTTFPVIQLKTWLKGRKQWSHSDWLELLEDLRNEGFAWLTDCEDGRTKIGQFLETEREIF